MARRIGWLSLVVLSVLMFASSLVSGTVGVATSISNRNAFGVVSSIVAAGFGVLFWRWILLGAWLRLRPPEGTDAAAVDPVGPWGVVGRVMLAALMVVATAGLLWAHSSGSSATERATKVRDEAVRAAKDRHLTVADVAAVRAAALTSAWDATGDRAGPSPYGRLLDLHDGEVVDVAVNGDEASILIRTSAGPPCAVVDITHGDIIRGRTTTQC